MRTFLRDYDWEQAFQNTDVNTKWDRFKDVVNSPGQRFVPISTKKGTESRDGCQGGLN